VFPVKNFMFLLPCLPGELYISTCSIFPEVEMFSVQDNLFFNPHPASDEFWRTYVYLTLVCVPGRAWPVWRGAPVPRGASGRRPLTLSWSPWRSWAPQPPPSRCHPQRNSCLCCKREVQDSLSRSTTLRHLDVRLNALSTEYWLATK
jgi:hypothetical protein